MRTLESVLEAAPVSVRENAVLRVDAKWFQIYLSEYGHDLRQPHVRKIKATSQGISMQV